MQNKQIEKLMKQVARYEAKGYKDTAAHRVLAGLLKDKSVAGISSGTPKKVKQEAQKNGE